jgi:hypothetical protein
MGKAETRRNEVCAQRWLFIFRQESIATVDSDEFARVERCVASMVRPSMRRLRGETGMGQSSREHCVLSVTVRLLNCGTNSACWNRYVIARLRRDSRLCDVFGAGSALESERGCRR